MCKVTIEVEDKRFDGLSDEEAVELVESMLRENVYRVVDEGVSLLRVTCYSSVN